MDTPLQELLKKFHDSDSESFITWLGRNQWRLLEQERKQGIQLVFNGMKFMAEDLGEQESNYQIAEKVYNNTFTNQ